MNQVWAFNCLPIEHQILDEKNDSVVRKLDAGIKCKTDNSTFVAGEVVSTCLIQLAKGALDYLVKSRDEIFGLLELGFDLGKKFGTFVVDYLQAVWNGTEAIFWAEQYIQGNEFFKGLANSIKAIPDIVSKILQNESEKYRCMNTKEKTAYVCHALTFVGPDVILIALGVWKVGGTLVSKIGPKLTTLLRAEKMTKAITVSTEVAAVTSSTNSARKVTTIAKLEALAKKIKHEPRPKAAIEIDRIGKIIEGAEDIKHLKDGVYLYIIDTEGNLVVTLRFPNLTGKGEILANHPALKKQLDMLKGGSSEVAAAGEFNMDGGVVTRISNKSGRYQGKIEHLNLGVETIKTKGFDVADDVKRVEYTTSENEITDKVKKLNRDPNDKEARKLVQDPEHTDDKRMIEYIGTIFVDDKTLGKMFDDYRDAYRKVAQNPKFKSLTPGRVDEDKVLSKLMEYVGNDPNKLDEAMAANHYLNNVANEQAKHFKGFKDNMKYKKEIREGALKLIQRLGAE